jgi:hypothetical protein
MSDDIESTPTGDEIEQAVETERDRINNNREQELMNELAEGGDAVAAETQDAIVEEPKPQTLKVKIDGLEEEVSIDELVKNYQKSESGDRRLQQAHQERQQLDQERQQLEQLRQQVTQQQPAQRNESLDELLSQRRDAMEIGDYEEFDRLDEEIATARNSGVKESVTNEAVQQIRIQADYERELQSFAERNQRIVADPVLYNMAMATLRNVCATSTTYAQAFEATEQAMNGWLERVAPSQVQQPVDDMANREARKQSIPQQPTGRNARTAQEPVEREQTPQEIIAGMRKARGLPV